MVQETQTHINYNLQLLKQIYKTCKLRFIVYRRFLTGPG